MSAVLVAIFNEYKVAERVRVELARDGFPTHRWWPNRNSERLVSE